jgi:hypothetical protein
MRAQRAVVVAVAASVERRPRKALAIARLRQHRQQSRNDAGRVELEPDVEHGNAVAGGLEAHL